jgi:hypothetical protein
MEWDLQFRSNSGQDDALSSLNEWARLYFVAIESSGPLASRRISHITQIEDLVRAARFEDVRCEMLEIPTCGWSDGKEGSRMRKRKG